MDKDQLLDLWVKFQSNHDSISDIGVFYTLFHEKRSKSELEKIFNGFPYRDDLVQKAHDLQSISKRLRKEEVVDTIKIDLLNKQNLCKTLGDEELVDVISKCNGNFEYSTKSEFSRLRKSDIPNNWLLELFGDYFRKNRIQNDLKVKALFEAFYGWTVNFQLVWFLGSPLINTNYDTTLYFKIWSGGWDYIIDNHMVHFIERDKGF